LPIITPSGFNIGITLNIVLFLKLFAKSKFPEIALIAPLIIWLELASLG
jgi:hypothetical protein